mmetsp:Transcript_23305/g.52890  ORF Transcript_23305/g.52890 Transcript_23305/m.52890 type:complete len:244 (-) Transcript_23305:213-944(-)
MNPALWPGCAGTGRGQHDRSLIGPGDCQPLAGIGFRMPSSCNSTRPPRQMPDQKIQTPNVGRACSPPVAPACPPDGALTNRAHRSRRHSQARRHTPRHSRACRRSRPSSARARTQRLRQPDQPCPSGRRSTRRRDPGRTCSRTAAWRSRPADTGTHRTPPGRRRPSCPAGPRLPRSGSPLPALAPCPWPGRSLAPAPARPAGRTRRAGGRPCPRGSTAPPWPRSTATATAGCSARPRPRRWRR